MVIVVHCPDCSGKMIWQWQIEEWYCDPCDYLMDREDVKKRGNFTVVEVQTKGSE